MGGRRTVFSVGVVVLVKADSASTRCCESIAWCPHTADAPCEVTWTRRPAVDLITLLLLWPWRARDVLRLPRCGCCGASSSASTSLPCRPPRAWDGPWACWFVLLVPLLWRAQQPVYVQQQPVSYCVACLRVVKRSAVALGDGRCTVCWERPARRRPRRQRLQHPIAEEDKQKRPDRQNGNGVPLVRERTYVPVCTATHYIVASNQEQDIQLDDDNNNNNNNNNNNMYVVSVSSTHPRLPVRSWIHPRTSACQFGIHSQRTVECVGMYVAVVVFGKNSSHEYYRYYWLLMSEFGGSFMVVINCKVHSK